MPFEQLHELFVEDVAHAEQLLALIESEHQALASHDLPILEALVNQKQPLLLLLGQHANTRHEILRQHNVSIDRAGLAQLVSLHGADAELLVMADRLAFIIEACQRANERSGSLILSSQKSVGKILNLLRGADATNLYNQKGNASGSIQARPLSQA